MQFSENEILFLMENYPKYGPKYCSKILKYPLHKIARWASMSGVKMVGRNKHPSDQKINPEQFWEIKTKEVAYFLGYFWADGYIKSYFSNTLQHKISLEIISSDAENISNILDSMGKWSKTTRKRNERWKETTTITTNSKDIYNFLKQNDYDIKSLEEPTKILDKIPQELLVYFWRGYFDGDGSLSINVGKLRKNNNLQFSSTYAYKWKELIKLMNKLGVKYNIYRKISAKGHSYSIVNIQNKQSILLFCEFLIKSDIGLTRKTEKLNQFLALKVRVDSKSNL
jgi:hypothetical protein